MDEAEAHRTRPPGEFGRWVGAARTALRTFLFGYDLFISYRNADGAACARSLYEGLRKKGLECFLDVHHYEAGHNLPWMQSQALRSSTKLLVVVTPRANASPPQGTDWLIAEVVEFKHVASRRGTRAAIIPFGTRDTLSKERFPASRLLPEIPSPDNEDICILDPAVERDGEVAEKSLEKIDADFKSFRRRKVRYAATAFAALLVLGTVAFGIDAGRKEAQARRAADLKEAFRLLDRGREAMTGEAGLAEARDLFDQSARILGSREEDRIMVAHHRFAASLQTLPVRQIAEVDREVSYLKLSADGNWMLVVHDYQAPNGSPEIEEIGDWVAFGMLHLPERKWTIKQPLKSAIGKEIYLGANVVELVPPAHVILSVQGEAGAEQYWKVSLETGEREAAARPAKGAHEPPAVARSKVVEARLKSHLSLERLFRTDPHDGIDREYGTRLVDSTYVKSPDGRTALVGTYEGRLMLLDLATGLSRGETWTSPIFAATYRQDGTKGYASSASHLWEVDATGWRGVSEFAVPPRTDPAHPRSTEVVLAIALSEDASVLAAATTDRLLSRSVRQGTWQSWPWPQRIEKIAALRVDARRSRIDAVVGDSGAIFSARYGQDAAPLESVGPSAQTAAPTVAWLDDAEPSVWLAQAKVGTEGIRVRKVSLTDRSAATLELPAVKLEDASSVDPPVVHALARLERALVVFHGDELDADDRRPVQDGRVLRIPLQGDAPSAVQTLFKARTFDNGPDKLSVATQVESVLPGAAGDRMFFLANDVAAYLLRRDGGLERFPNATAVLEHRTRDQSYLVQAIANEGDAWLSIRHLASGSLLKYQLPWAFSMAPTLAVIASGGRRAALANRAGEFLMVDVEQASHGD